ncbi:MAG: S41 family peptidase [Lachnospiraceae bacterium]|nr:S41 family peptidase [Lachnospiraceae bacterium]
MEPNVDRDWIRKAKRKSFLTGMATGLVLMLVLICGICAGYQVYRLIIVKNNFSVQSGAQETEYDTMVTAEMLEKMQTIEYLIRKNYYKDEDISTKALEEGVYSGMIASLGDMYSDYYTQEELEALMQQTQGIYYGIGAGVSLDTTTSYPKIIKVYDGTPAQEAGLREEDIIYEVEGENTYGLDLTEVVSRIKGDEGSWVNLTVVREGETDYLSIDVQRRKVNIPTVEFEMLEDGMAYIIISEFDDVTVDQFAEALAMARGNDMKGLILDLRGNPGGSLDAVVKISQKILPKGLIVYTEDKYGQRKEYSCDGTKQLEVPLVVLINGNSASASEILAGAVKDYGIGTLVGTTTYGKGIVQSVIPMIDGSAVKVTISSYFTPNGNDIHGTGVEPDVECVFDGEAYYSDPERPDNQLEKAKEVLGELLK